MENIFKNKLFFIVSIIVFIIFISIYGIKIKKEKNIDELVKHFENVGLKVEDVSALTGEEKELVDGFKNTTKSLGLTDKSNIVEKKSYMIESIKVSFSRYKDKASAQKVYDYYVGFEERKKKRAERERSPYTKTVYFINGSFFAMVRYYEVKVVQGGIGANKIEINEEGIDKIQKAFSEFK